MQGFLLFSVFIGIGINMLCQKYPRFSTTIKIGCICVLLLQVGLTYPEVIPLTTENTYLESYAESELQSLPSNSIYIAFGDYHQNSMLYLHQSCHKRSDVTILYLPYASYLWFNQTQLPLYPQIQWPGTVYHPYGSILHGEGGNAFNLTEFINANIQQHRLFITAWMDQKEKLPEQYSLWPVGLFYEVRE